MPRSNLPTRTVGVNESIRGDSWTCVNSCTDRVDNDANLTNYADPIDRETTVGKSEKIRGRLLYLDRKPK